MNDENNTTDSIANKTKEAKKTVEDLAKKKKIILFIASNIGSILLILLIVIIFIFCTGVFMTLANWWNDEIEKKEAKAEERFYNELEEEMKYMYSKFGVKINPDLITNTLFFMSDLEQEDLELEDLETVDAKSYTDIKIKDIKKLALAQILRTSIITKKYTCYTNITTITILETENEDETVTKEEIKSTIDENTKIYDVGSYKVTSPYNSFDESHLTEIILKNNDNSFPISEGKYSSINSVEAAISQYKKDYPSAVDVKCSDTTSNKNEYQLSYEKFSHYLRTDYLIHWTRDQIYALENLPNTPYCKEIGESIEAIEMCVDEMYEKLSILGKVNSVDEVENVIEWIVEFAKYTYDENSDSYSYGGYGGYSNQCSGSVISGGESKPLTNITVLSLPDWAISDIASPMDKSMTVTDVVRMRDDAKYHYGIDLVPSDNSKENVALYAVSGGKVITAISSCNPWVTDGCNSNAGNMVTIQLDNPDGEPGIIQKYMHMSVVDVSVGDIVKPGTKIGEMGNSGSGTGAHLHFEIRGVDGSVYDPANTVLQPENCSSEDYTGFAISAADKEEAKSQLMANGFPENYADALAPLQVQYSTFVFKPINVGKTLSETIKSQSGKALVQGSSNSTGVAHATEIGWYYATDKFIEYNINPLNHFNINSIFQFQDLNYDSSLEAEYLAQVKYLVDKSFLSGNDYEYSIMKSGNKNSLDPVSLISKIIQEVGYKGSISSTGAIFTCSDGKFSGFYNLFNIAAFGKGPAEQGLCFAKDSGKYSRPWDSIEKSIEGGAQYLSAEYITKGQQTKYFQRFNVNPNSGYSFGSHQYMTNVEGAKTEGNIMYNSLKETGNLNGEYKFLIPVYN